MKQNKPKKDDAWSMASGLIDLDKGFGKQDQGNPKPVPQPQSRNLPNLSTYGNQKPDLTGLGGMSGGLGQMGMGGMGMGGGMNQMGGMRQQPMGGQMGNMGGMGMQQRQSMGQPQMGMSQMGMGNMGGGGMNNM